MCRACTVFSIFFQIFLKLEESMQDSFAKCTQSLVYAVPGVQNPFIWTFGAVFI